MPQPLQKLLADAKGGKFSSINGLSDDDVANVWENVSTYIEKQMSSSKGVQIPGFGTFSFSQRKLDVGNNKFVLMQRPVFNISEKFAQTHGLQFTKYAVPGHIPFQSLNFAAMSFESPFDRDTVESCVREIVGSVSRAVAAHKNVELHFSGIGRLQIREGRVKMRFYKEFINQMDGSGELLATMQNRAGTVDSVMSNRPFSRPGSVNTLVLPRPKHPERPRSAQLDRPSSAQSYRLSKFDENPGCLTSQPSNGCNIWRQPLMWPEPPYYPKPQIEQSDRPRSAQAYRLSKLEDKPGSLTSRPSNGYNTLRQPLMWPEPPLYPKIQPGAGGNANANALPPLAEVDENQNYSPREPQIDQIGNPVVLQHVPDRPEEQAEGDLFQAQTEQQIGTEALRSNAFGDNNVGDDVAEDCALNNALHEAAARDEPPDVYHPKSVEELLAEKKAGSRAPSRQAMQLAKASGVSYLDDLQVPAPKMSPAPPAAEPRGATFAEMPMGSGRGLVPPTPPRLEPLQRSRSADNTGSHNIYGGASDRQYAREKAMTPPGTSCGHPNDAGQELCYLCHQRARRNIPVSFTVERKRREDEEDRLLQQYQAMRDAEDILREQERHVSRRCDLQKISAFNLGVSEAVGAQKRSKDTQPQRSYLFNRRPLTPSRFPKQEEYLRELQRQVNTRVSTEAKNKADEDFLERLEQVQLAEDLAAQREKYIRDKADDINTYKSALDTQLKFKPIPLPPKEPDNEVFGKNDTNNEKIMERRRRAYMLFQDQQRLVEERKREAILKRLAEQEREQEVLEKTKDGMQEDRAFRHHVRFDSRRQLEDDWQKAADTKRQRDLEDRLIGLESGGLLHEQCDQYRRCKQCKKRTDNCGESNIWRESRYIPGSRIMV